MVTLGGWKILGPLKHSLLQSPEMRSQSLNPPFLCKPLGKALPPHVRLVEEGGTALLAVPLLPREVMVSAEPKGSGSDDDSQGCHHDATQQFPVLGV